MHERRRQQSRDDSAVSVTLRREVSLLASGDLIMIAHSGRSLLVLRRSALEPWPGALLWLTASTADRSLCLHTLHCGSDAHAAVEAQCARGKIVVDIER